MNTTTPIGAKAPVLPTLRAALGRALQWRLWLLFAGASLSCALLAGLPVWNWLAGVLNHSVHVDAIAAGQAPALLLDAGLAADVWQSHCLREIDTHSPASCHPQHRHPCLALHWFTRPGVLPSAPVCRPWRCAPSGFTPIRRCSPPRRPNMQQS